MLAELPAERMWTLSEDAETVRMQLPPLPIAGIICDRSTLNCASRRGTELIEIKSQPSRWVRNRIWAVPLSMPEHRDARARVQRVE